jgi:prophage regulatory protein
MKILRLKGVIEITGLSRATIYRRMRDNTFPMSVPLGPNTVGWFEHEIHIFLEQALEEREQRLSSDSIERRRK